MELILISDSKIKIMLTPSDMNRFELSPDILEDGNEENIRTGFREVLQEVQERTGFDAHGNRLYIQYYPSRKGGCELFVTKLGQSSSESQFPVCSGAVSGGLAHLEQKYDTGKHRRVCAYSFGSISLLLSVCRRLSAVPYLGESTAWRGEDGTVFLFLYEMNGTETRPYFDPFWFLAEYGTAENPDSLLLYIKEHGSPICESDAVATLSTL